MPIMYVNIYFTCQLEDHHDNQLGFHTYHMVQLYRVVLILWFLYLGPPHYYY
jgi:hypothetical protein